MHPPNVLTTMEQVFDGVIEMRLYEEGLAITPLFRVRKMLGLAAASRLLPLCSHQYGDGGNPTC